MDAPNSNAYSDRQGYEEEAVFARSDGGMIQSRGAHTLAHHAIGFTFFEDLGFFSGSHFERLRARGYENIAFLERDLPNGECANVRPHASA